MKRIGDSQIPSTKVKGVRLTEQQIKEIEQLAARDGRRKFANMLNVLIDIGIINYRRNLDSQDAYVRGETK